MGDVSPNSMSMTYLSLVNTAWGHWIIITWNDLAADGRCFTEIMSMTYLSYRSPGNSRSIVASCQWFHGKTNHLSSRNLNLIDWESGKPAVLVLNLNYYLLAAFKFEWIWMLWNTWHETNAGASVKWERSITLLVVEEINTGMPIRHLVNDNPIVSLPEQRERNKSKCHC